MKYWTPRRTQTLALWGLVALYIVARAGHLAAICLDGDEIFSITIAGSNWAKLTADAARDSVHPPTFYYLLKLWIGLGGDSLMWLRTLPALFSVLSLIPLVLLCRQLRLRRAEINCAIGIAAVNPLLIYYSQHLRMYSLLLLCASTSVWLFHRVIQASPRDLTWRILALTAANTLLVYSHYYGWLVVGFEGIYILLWKRDRFWPAALSTAAVMAAFGPWLYVAAQAALAKGGLSSNLDWIPKPTLGDVVWMLTEFMGFGDFPDALQPVAWVMFVLLVGVGIGAMANRQRRGEGNYAHAVGFLAFFVLGPMLAAFAASVMMKNSIWGQRHLIFVAQPLLVLCVIPFFRLRYRTVRIGGILLCAFWSILVIQHQLRGDDKKTPYDSLVFGVLASEAQSRGPMELYALDRYVHYPFWFYSNVLKEGRVTGIAAPLSPPGREALARAAKRLHIKENVSVEDARGAHFWVAFSNKRWNRPESPQQVLARRDCRSGTALSTGDRYHTISAIPVWCAVVEGRQPGTPAARPTGAD